MLYVLLQIPIVAPSNANANIHEYWPTDNHYSRPRHKTAAIPSQGIKFHYITTCRLNEICIFTSPDNTPKYAKKGGDLFPL